MDSIKYQQIKNQNLTASVRNLIMDLPAGQLSKTNTGHWAQNQASAMATSDLNPVEDEWGELKRRRCESEDLEWFWMKEWSLISCQVFSDLNPVEDEWGELKRRSCESEDLEWFWMKEWSLISCQVFSDLNPVEHEWVNWRGEAVNLKIWRDAVWRKQSLISYQVFSKLFRHYRRQLRAVTLGKGRCNNWVPIFVANMNKRKHLFHNEISPTFNCFTSMIGWKCLNER